MSYSNSKDNQELSLINSEDHNKTNNLSRCFSQEKSAVISINTNMKSMTREDKLVQWKLLNGKSFKKQTTPMKLASSRKKSIKFEDTLRRYQTQDGNNGRSTGRKFDNLDGNTIENSNYSGTKYSGNLRDRELELSLSKSRMSEYYNRTISEKCSINRTLNFGKTSVLSNKISNNVEDKWKFSQDIEKVYDSFEKWNK